MLYTVKLEYAKANLENLVTKASLGTIQSIGIKGERVYIISERQFSQIKKILWRKEAADEKII